MSLNIIPQDADIVLVGLNPTEEAIQNGAVWSTTRHIWNILQDSGITNNTDEFDVKSLAERIFQNGECCEIRLGIADLVEDNYSKSSKHVKPLNKNVSDLLNTLAKKKVKKVGLMGQKVVDAFGKFTKEKKWKNTFFGKMYSVKIGNNELHIYKLPFPTGMIPDKAEKYKTLLVEDNRKNLG